MQIVVHKELIKLKRKYYQLLSFLSVEEITSNQRLRPMLDEVDNLLKKEIKKSLNRNYQGGKGE